MKRSTLGLTSAALVTGTLLTGLLFVETRRQEDIAFHKDLSLAAENRVAAIRRELEAGLAALHALRSYMETSPLDDPHFDSLASKLIDSSSTVRSLEWVPRVTGLDRVRFEKEIAPHFIYSGNPSRPRREPDDSLYYPVRFVYPPFRNGVVVGFDLNSSALCREALTLAQNGNSVALTEKLRVVENTADGYGVIAFLPAFRKVDNSAQPQLAGFALAVLQVPDVVVAGIHRLNERSWDLYVFDRLASASKQLLYYHPAPNGTQHGPVAVESDLNGLLNEKVVVSTGGRQWAFVFVPTPEYIASGQHTWRSWILLAIGAFLTAASVAYLLIDAAHRKQLAAARDQALDASRSKSQFLANMSHEIRTPMNGVLATTELVLNTNLTGEQRELVNACHVSGQQLLALLNEILDLSRCEAGKLTLESVPFDLRAEVESILQLFTVSAQQKNVSLRLDWDEKTPQWVRGDPTRIRQVLTNLMSNAVKFTEHGSVGLSVTSKPRGEQGLAVQIAIEDTGIGIPPDILPNLFSPFVQADGSTTRRYGGTGLGLAICKQIVNLMGGSINVSSKAGQGSRFVVDLELERANPVAAAQDELLDTPLPSTTRVLLAEDNPVNQLVAQRLLERQGCQVELAATGAEAVERCRTQQYDLILMDCQMPELDGYEAARQIRAIRPHDRTPIIALTAQAFPGDRERCLEAGMDDYVAKPINAARLLATVRRWISTDVEV